MVDVANIHLPVLLDDCVNLMAPALEHENAIAVDCTLGLAGHSIAFLKAAPQARLIGIDRDSEALGLATERMEREGLAMPPSISSIRCWRTKTSNAWTPYSWIWDYPACRSTKPIVASPIRMMRRWICAWTSASR